MLHHSSDQPNAPSGIIWLLLATAQYSSFFRLLGSTRLYAISTPQWL
jgi:hypothetical protein